MAGPLPSERTVTYGAITAWLQRQKCKSRDRRLGSKRICARDCICLDRIPAMRSEPTFTLTPEEKKLLAQIDFELEGDARSSLNAAGQLAQALLKRKAIPTMRLRWFTDPKLNIGVSCSREEVFERNGTRGNDILFHGNFVKYLRYFLFGPDLPAATMTAFQQRVKECGGFVSGSDYPDLDQIVRSAVRTHRLYPGDAAEEFFKLALECGLEPFTARHFRDTAKKIRQ